PQAAKASRLHEARHAGRRDGRVGEARVPGVRGRTEVLARAERHLPGDRLAGVGGHAAHDGQERAPGHVLAVVERPAGADAGGELVVLGLVHVVRRPVVVDPGLLACLVAQRDAAATLLDLGEAATADRPSAHVVGAAALLARVAGEPGAVRIL